MAKYLLLALVLAAGLSQPFQVAMHARLNKVSGSPMVPAMVTSALALIIALGLWAIGVGGRGTPAQLSDAPWWTYLCGAIGVLLVTSGLVALPISGAALVVAVMVFGQMLASMLVDHFGWLGVKQQPANPWRIAGVVVIFAGVLMMQKK